MAQTPINAQQSPTSNNKILLLVGAIVVILILVIFSAVSLKSRKSVEDQSNNTDATESEQITEVPPSTPTPVILQATLSLEPANANFEIDEVKEFVLTAKFTNGQPERKLDYFKTEISFDNKYLVIPSGRYADVSESGFGKIIKVDGPVIANQNGKMIIELGATESNGGPATDKPLTIAKIYFKGLAETDTVQNVTFGNTQIVNNLSEKIAVDTVGLTYGVASSASTSGANQ